MGYPKFTNLVSPPPRSILSACGTYNSGLVIMLVKRLNHLRKYETVIRDTFSFIDTWHKLDFDTSTTKLVSFDVTSLFTKVPVRYTIQLIFNELYGSPHTCQDFRLKREFWCKNYTDRFNMKLLLEIATVKTHFIFNDNLYCQIEGIAMGSPLRPVFADIFMIHLWKAINDYIKK